MKDNKQTLQFVLLGVLVVVCIGVVAFRLVPKKSVPVKPSSAAHPSTTAQGGGEGSMAQGGDEGSVAQGGGEVSAADPSTAAQGGDQAQGQAAKSPDGGTVAGAGSTDGETVVAKVPATAGRDPFAPAMDTSVHVDMPRPPVRLARVRTGNVPNLSNWFGGGTTPAGHGAGQAALPPMTPTVADETPEPPAPEFVLTGVITGETNVAIIRLNDNRYIVREGQTIDGTYRVVSVTPKSVRLAYSGHGDIVLELGG